MIRNYGRPFPAGIIYPEAVYRIMGAGKRIYLTFDDGPDPVSTPVILDILRAHDVHATFFCTGSRVLASPGLFARVAAEGHTVGNHGFSHLNGLTTSIRSYCSDIYKGRDITCSNLFRPPYGRLRVRQYRILERTMRIVFWDLMPYDFDRRLRPESSYGVLSRRVRPGSVIVLHDTASSSAAVYLGRFIQKAVEEGYSFGTIDDYSLHG
ncbi:polysaccharide deacetylase family protein [bacterium]|nr:polysaccharide deacetylase family protein [bacterium]